MAGWDIRRIYLYLVSFATLMMMIVGTVQIIQAVVDFTVKQPREFAPKSVRYEELSKNTKLTKAEIEKQIKEEEAMEQERQRYWRIRRLIDNLALIVVAAPVYVYHWRKIQRAEAKT
jgi:hypothetical protein